MDSSSHIIKQTHVPKSVLIVIICLFLIVFTGCSKDKGTIIVAPINSVPNGYDPQIATGNDLETIINNCFEGLVRIDSAGNIQKGVATDWSISKDGLTYTFTLRADAKWRVPKSASEALGEDFIKTLDTRVTANDFAFAIKRALDPATGAPFAYSLSSVESAFAKDDTTLIIRLKSPNESLLTTLASPICMPCNEKFFNETAGRYGLSTSLILSNGPYYLGLFDADTGTVTLKKNDNYKGNYTALNSTIRLYVDSEENKHNYNIKQISYEEATSLSKKKKNSDITVIQYRNSLKAFCFNCKNEIFLNYRSIRLAFAHSTNVDALVKPGVSKAEGVVPSTCSLQAGVTYRANANILFPLEYDIDKAIEIFDKIKTANENKEIPDDLSLKIKLVCLESDVDDIKTIIQGWQKTFGVSMTLTLEPYETQEELDKVIKKGEYDIAYTTIVSSDFLASEFLKNFTTGATGNIINLQSTEYDQLISESYKAETKDDLTETLLSCEQFLLDNAYIIPTITKDTYISFDLTGSEVTLRPSGNVMAFYK